MDIDNDPVIYRPSHIRVASFLHGGLTHYQVVMAGVEPTISAFVFVIAHAK
jgi:hypothetical protein